MPLLAPIVAAALVVSHVRAESHDTRRFIQEAAERSAIVHALIDRLEQSDVVAYVRFVAFSGSLLEGRVGFISRAGNRRYVAIEVACGRDRTLQIATFAHELQHVLEIAAAPAVVDAGTLAIHYGRIGLRMTDTYGHQTFETLAAIETGRRARRDITGGAARAATGDR